MVQCTIFQKVTHLVLWCCWTRTVYLLGLCWAPVCPCSVVPGIREICFLWLGLSGGQPERPKSNNLVFLVHSSPHSAQRRTAAHISKQTGTRTHRKEHTRTQTCKKTLPVCRVFFWCCYVHFHWAGHQRGSRHRCREHLLCVRLGTQNTACCNVYTSLLVETALCSFRDP